MHKLGRIGWWNAVGLVAIMIVGLLPAAARAQGQAGALGYKGAKSTAKGGNLVDQGGPITPISHTYAIFWGPSTAWPADVVGGIGTLFQGFNGSNYLGIGQQYMRGAAIGSAYEQEISDPSTPPNKASTADLGAEVQKEYGTNLDPSGIYFVYTSDFPKGGGFCAWHSFATVGTQNVAVAYMPDTNGVAGCDPGNPYNLPGSEALRSLANVTAHEFMESVTDTQPASHSYAWIDANHAEIGDKCAWQFTGPVTLSNNSVWQLQEEWSNASSGCAQGQ